MVAIPTWEEMEKKKLKQTSKKLQTGSWGSSCTAQPLPKEQQEVYLATEKKIKKNLK